MKLARAKGNTSLAVVFHTPGALIHVFTYPCSMQSLMPGNQSAQVHNPMRPGYGVVARNPPFFSQSLEKPQQYTDMCMVVPYQDLGKVDSATTV